MVKKVLLVLFAFGVMSCAKDDEPEFGLKSNDGLVSHYPLNNNGKDHGPNSINGTVEGTEAAYDRKGNANGAIYFDGADDFIKIGNFFKAHEIQTIAFWVKFKDLKEGMSSMELISKSSQRQGIEVVLHESKLQFFIMGKERSNNIGIPISRLNSEDWYFVTAIYDIQEATMKLFLNGELEQASWAPASVSEVDNLLFGNWNYEDAPRFFNGYLDDVKIYNRALTEEEVKSLYIKDL